MKIIKKLILVILSLFLLVSCGGPTESLDVINPDADYIYFYGKTCPHCIELNKYFVENDIMNKYEIEKREIWNNKVNHAFFTKIIEGLGLPPEKVGVPFLYNKSEKSYLIGPQSIIELLDGNVPVLTK